MESALRKKNVRQINSCVLWIIINWDEASVQFDLRLHHLGWMLTKREGNTRRQEASASSQPNCMWIVDMINDDVQGEYLIFILISDLLLSLKRNMSLCVVFSLHFIASHRSVIVVVSVSNNHSFGRNRPNNESMENHKPFAKTCLITTKRCRLVPAHIHWMRTMMPMRLQMPTTAMVDRIREWNLNVSAVN